MVQFFCNLRFADIIRISVNAYEAPDDFTNFCIIVFLLVDSQLLVSYYDVCESQITENLPDPTFQYKTHLTNPF